MKKMSTVLIIVGIIIGFIPIVGQIHTYYQQRLLTKEFHYSLQEAFEGNIEGSQQSYNIDNLQEVQKTSISESTSNVEEVEIPEEDSLDLAKQIVSRTSQTLIGMIKIEKINVEVPIVEGTKDENLKIGVGHLSGTSSIGQAGNSALAGHRSYTFGKFFNRLDELEVGDKIEITTNDANYIYYVYKKHIVEPTDVWVLEGKDEEKILTLITCEPIYTATHRLIIHAILGTDPRLF